MAQPFIPDWLKTGDAGAEFARGLAAGQQAREAENRIQAAQAESQMRAQAHAEQVKRQSMIETARIQTQAAYQQQQLGLQQQRVQQAQEVIGLRTKAAADSLAARARYTKILQDNPDMPQSEALIRSGFGSAANIGAARSLETSETQRAADFGLRQQAEKRLQTDLERRTAEAELKRNMPVVVGSESESVEDDTGKRTTTRRNVYGAPGENAPPRVGPQSHHVAPVGLDTSGEPQKKNRFRYDPANDALTAY